MNFGALILTQDEERQIEGCLASLVAARRIVVVDSGSTDATLSILRRTPEVEILNRPFASFADQRNFGLERCFAPGEWVLHLDADERLTKELADELASLDPSEQVVAYNVASRTFLRGKPILRAAGYPVYQTRLTRAGAFRFEDVGHGQKAPAAYGSLPRLQSAYDHHPFEKGNYAWRKRHLAYADREVRDIRSPTKQPAFADALRDPVARRQWLKYATAYLPGRPTFVWLYLMILKRGALDGRAGWEYCRLRWEYERMVSRLLRDPQ